jgi:UDP-2-acetamido-3-amino-2,3-dideoxy-glucuronate N-acetyltransferase
MFKIIDIPNHVSHKGSLSAIELQDLVPFDVKRVYWAYNNLSDRGAHCHKTEKEFFVLVNGSMKMRIHDGKNETIIDMKPHIQGYYVANKIWHEFIDFSEDSVLLCLSSTNYIPDRSDYIEEFNEFLNYVS